MTTKQQREVMKRLDKLELRIHRLEKPVSVVPTKSKHEKMKDGFKKQILRIA